MEKSKLTNYKMGALKRKFQTGKEDMPPGTFISKVNEVKKEIKINESAPKEKLSIMGLV